MASNLTPDEQAQLRALIDKVLAPDIKVWRPTSVNALEAALHDARPGEIIDCADAPLLTANFVAPHKDGTVTLRNAALKSPDHLPALSISGSNWSLLTSHLEGKGTVLALGNAPQTLSQVPHNILVDGCNIVADPVRAKRGIALNSGATTIKNCKITGFRLPSGHGDAQGICGWNGPGPYLIEANEISGAGQGILFGGGDPSIPDLVPTNIVIRYNNIYRPLSWKGTPYQIKGMLLELKNARHVIAEYNSFSGSWASPHDGDASAFVFKSVNQDGKAPWSVVHDVTFRYNTATDIGAGFNLHPCPTGPAQPASKFLIERNRLTVNRATFGGTGRIALLQGVADVSFLHNTFENDGATTFYFDGLPNERLVISRNIFRDNNWAIMGGNTGEGPTTLSRYAPGGIVTENLIITSSPHLYPGNRCEPTLPADTTGYGAA
jgi:hypothetical protein